MGKEITFYGEQFQGLSDHGEFTQGRVFLIMPFAEEFNDTFSAIVDECQKLRLDASRVDVGTGSGLILRKIFKEIEDSEFIIVDLTDERPNVYYELGYAHGVGNGENDILLVAKQGVRLHFDIAPLSVKFYSSTEDLRKIVHFNLKEMIRLTR
ncbi:MAG: nucleotide-binding protein [Clostridiales bacterium]|jgi:hypothetical protein|nr:nucleotide-binding protein [Clostridiales bacterium]